MTEQERISVLVSGDLDAFEELVGQYQKRIYAMCFRYTLDARDAQDLTQEVFLAVFKSLPRFRGESALNTWIYRIVLNKIYSSKKRVTHSDADILERVHTGPADPYAKTDSALDIQKCIRSLPLRYRQIIELFYFHDLPQSDIAHILQLPPRTVETRLYRARDRLKNMLGMELYGKEVFNG